MGAVSDVAAYLRERQQFGRSLSSFQALQHRLAELAVDAHGASVSARSAAYAGTSTAALGAAAYAVDVAARAVPELHQLSGARRFHVRVRAAGPDDAAARVADRADGERRVCRRLCRRDVGRLRVEERVMATSIESLDLPEVDVLAPEYEHDPTATLRAAREAGGGMMRTHRGVEILSYRWVDTLINHPAFHTVDARHFAQKGGPDSLIEFAENGLLLSMTGEQHDRIRRVLLKAFALRRVDQNRAVMTELVDQKVDAFAAAGRADLVADLTEPYPMEVLCRLIGIPTADLDRFVFAAREMHLMAEVPMAPGFERIDAALRTMRDYVVELVELRRSDPQDDLLTGVVEAEHTEGRLTEAELVGNMINVLFAGGGHDPVPARLGTSAGDRARPVGAARRRPDADPELRRGVDALPAGDPVRRADPRRRRRDRRAPVPGTAADHPQPRGGVARPRGVPRSRRVRHHAPEPQPLAPAVRLGHPLLPRRRAVASCDVGGGRAASPTASPT